MFSELVTIYNESSTEGEERTWQVISFVEKDEIWHALQEKIKSLSVWKYPFALTKFAGINELIKAVRGFVKTNKLYNEVYGKSDSDELYKDLIDIAKVIALYQHELNYHRYLLCDDLLAESIEYEKLYHMRHSELCAVKNRPGENIKEYDLIPFADLMDQFRASCRLRNFYNNQSIDPNETIASQGCPYREEYENFCREISGSLSKPTYYALKDFVELVSNEFDAGHSIDGCFFQWRVTPKYRAFLNLCGYLESLPEDDLAALHAVKINGNTTFLSRLTEIKAGGCVSVFADDITKLLYQCKNDIQFTNPRPTQIIEEEGNQLVLRGKVIDTNIEDRWFLENLQKIILNTTFKVRIGTKVTSADGESNQVPSHVAEMFNICTEALAGRMETGEARYKAIKVAAECFRNPHNSIFFFMNTRDPTSHNFYGMVIDREFSTIIAVNEDLDNHASFMTVGIRK